MNRVRTWVVRLGALGVVIAILIGLNALIEEPSKQEKAALDRLEPNAGEYAAASGTPTPGRPRLSGRMVPISLGEHEIDEGVFTRLPGELQARSPQEVSTIALIEYRQKVVGQYGDGADALRDFADITIVDLVSGKQYEGKTIAGLEPVSVKAGGGDQEGQPVDKGDIPNYLANLPR